MPSYTFSCPQCHYRFTGLFAMKDSEGKDLVCPKCGARGLKRVYSASSGLVTKVKNNSACGGAVCPTCSGGTCNL